MMRGSFISGMAQPQGRYLHLIASMRGENYQVTGRIGCPPLQRRRARWRVKNLGQLPDYLVCVGFGV